MKRWGNNSFWYDDIGMLKVRFYKSQLFGTEGPTLYWPHNERDGVSNHRRPDCLLNRLFRRRSKEHQSSALLAFVRGIRQRDGKCFHLMTTSLYVCNKKLCFRQNFIVAFLVPSLYLNQCRCFVNWMIEEKLKLNLNRQLWQFSYTKNYDN